MIIAEFFIPGEFSGLNEYTNDNRAHWSKGASAKKQETLRVQYELNNVRTIPEENFPLIIEFHWRSMDKKHDPDNICFAKKFILDGMVKARIITNDGWEQIAGFMDTFRVDTKSPGVIVVIKQAAEV